MSVKNGRPDGLRRRREPGLRHPGCRRRRLGLRQPRRGSSRARSSASPAAPSRSLGPAPWSSRAGRPRRADPLGRQLRHAGPDRPVHASPWTRSWRALLEADAAMRAVQGIAVAEGSFECQRIRKTFASTEGSYVEQTLVETGAGIEALAVGEDDAQRRSFPNSFGRQHSTAGYEYFQSLNLAENASRTAEEAVKLLTAKPCPDDVTTVILDSSQAALQVHESCGHPIELDRVFGTEASYAGTSFLTLDKRGDVPVRLGARHHRGRRDDPRRARHVRLRRRGRPGPADDHRRSRHLQELPDLPRDGRAARRVEQRHDARGRLEPHPPDPHDEHQPGARRLVAGRPDRRHRPGRLPPDQPKLEHRRRAPQLPVRHRDRLGDQERQARRDAQERHLHRHHAALLGRLRRRRARTGPSGARRTAARGSRPSRCTSGTARRRSACAASRSA